MLLDPCVTVELRDGKNSGPTAKGPRICADLEKESKTRKKGELMIQFCVKILNSLIAFQTKSLEN